MAAYCSAYQRTGVNYYVNLGQKEICGKGYSCYFSGFNYQCCPSDEDDDNGASLECPVPAFTVLGNDGSAIRCDLRSRPCPQKSMFCTNIGTEMICCEGTASHEASEVEVTAKGDAEHIEPDIDCPTGSFTILDHNGRTIRCDDKACTENGRFCHEKHGVTICCERSDKLITKDERSSKYQDEDQHSAQNPLKYMPPTTGKFSSGSSSSVLASSLLSIRSDKLHKLNYFDGTAKLKQHKQPSRTPDSFIADRNMKTSSTSNSSHGINQPSILLTETSQDATTTSSPNELSTYESPSPDPTANRSIVADDSFASSTETPDISNALSTLEPSRLRTSSEEREKVRGVPLGNGVGVVPTETIRYTPHSAGGYAVSRVFSVKTALSHEDAREYARRYLLRQIRNGWPYNDRYYTSAGMNADRIPMPDAHVVFQSE
ncbi:unnamed protein product [Toxocara canis]|uniref:EB domain-containing protein n=1 Tax=Toxocara canis TaxID=6265 RepID=A0A183UGU2_TOXCA|nr:unnamed protein product [Toxocara canis]